MQHRYPVDPIIIATPLEFIIFFHNLPQYQEENIPTWITRITDKTLSNLNESRKFEILVTSCAVRWNLSVIFFC